MVCLNCGKEIPDNVKFCVYCGKKVENNPESIQKAEPETGDIAVKQEEDDIWAIPNDMEENVGSVSAEGADSGSSGDLNKNDSNKDASDKSEASNDPVRERLIYKAERGDLESILTLGHYDFDKGATEDNDIDEAIKWLLVGDQFGYFICTVQAANLMSYNRYIIRDDIDMSVAKETIEQLEPMRRKILEGMEDSRNSDITNAKDVLSMLEAELGICYYYLFCNMSGIAQGEELKEYLQKSSRYLKTRIGYLGEDRTLKDYPDVAYFYAFAVTDIYCHFDENEPGSLEKAYYYLNELKDANIKENWRGLIFYNLGLLCGNGMGCPQDGTRAYLYYQRAADFGVDTTKRLEELADYAPGRQSPARTPATTSGTSSSASYGNSYGTSSGNVNSSPRQPKGSVAGIVMGAIGVSMGVYSLCPNGPGIFFAVVGFILGICALVKTASLKKYYPYGSGKIKAGKTLGGIAIALSAIGFIINLVYVILYFSAYNAAHYY